MLTSPRPPERYLHENMDGHSWLIGMNWYADCSVSDHADISIGLWWLGYSSSLCFWDYFAGKAYKNSHSKESTTQAPSATKEQSTNL
jgi:hypothetical protein